MLQEQALEPEGVQEQERSGLVDGVIMSDVMESTISALNTLSSTSMVFRDSIDDLGVRPLLKKLLHEGQLQYDVDTAARNLLESLEGGGGGGGIDELVPPPRSASLHGIGRQQQQVYEEIPAEYETVVSRGDLRQMTFHGSTQLEVRREGVPSTPTRSTSLSSGGRRSSASARSGAAVETQWVDSEV